MDYLLANADPGKLSTWNSFVDDAKEFVQKFSSRNYIFLVIQWEQLLR